jgi:hypothetical protein
MVLKLRRPDEPPALLEGGLHQHAHVADRSARRLVGVPRHELRREAPVERLIDHGETGVDLRDKMLGGERIVGRACTRGKKRS